MSPIEKVFLKKNKLCSKSPKAKQFDIFKKQIVSF